MDYDPSAELREFERRKRLGLLDATPDMLADGLEGAATPIEIEPTVGAEEVGNEEMFARQAARIKTDDYRREQALYRVAKVTGTPIAELMQQPEWAGLGEVRGEAVVPLAARAAMKQTRMDGEQERMDAWKAQMKLASSNTRSNMSNAFGMLSPEQQQRVIESRMTGNRQDNNDPRLAMAQLDAETRRAEGQDTRASNREIAEANRIAAREEREGVRESEERRFGAQTLQTTQHNDMVVKKMDQQQALLIEQLRNGQTTAAADTALKIKELELRLTQSDNQTKALIANATAANTSAEVVERIRAEAQGGPAGLAMKRMEDDEKRRGELMRMKFAAEQPGAYNAAIGLPTADAETYLKQAAREADRFQFLPGGGFGEREAGAFNAALLALARQAEQAGVPNRLGDRAYREELIRKYGYASGWSGGRGGWMGDFFQPIPNDPPMAPR